MKAATLEVDNIDGTAQNCINVVATCDSLLAPSLHKSRVTAIVACKNSILRGGVYGVQILDAGYVDNASAQANVVSVFDCDL